MSFNPEEFKQLIAEVIATDLLLFSELERVDPAAHIINPRCSTCSIPETAALIYMGDGSVYRIDVHQVAVPLG